MGWNAGSQIKPDRTAYSGHYAVLIASPKKAGRDFIFAPRFTCAVDGHNQDLMVAQKFPPALTWVSVRMGFTLVSCPEKRR